MFQFRRALQAELTPDKGETGKLPSRQGNCPVTQLIVQLNESLASADENSDFDTDNGRLVATGGTYGILTIATASG